MSKQLAERLESMYTDLWTSPPEEILSGLDVSQKPARPADLYETVGSPLITENDSILDLGCGLGTHSFRLAERFKCSVTGIDLCKANLQVATETCLRKGLEGLVDFKRLNIEDLSFADESYSLVWCRDVLIHVEDLEKAFNECSRVLKKGGGMIIYTTFKTPLMSEIDIEWTLEPLNLTPGNLDRYFFENSFQAADLTIAKRVELGSQWVEYNEENSGQASKYLRRIARMQRAREVFEPLLGKETFEVTAANYRWHIFMMLGKLSSTAYYLKKT